MTKRNPSPADARQTVWAAIIDHRDGVNFSVHPSNAAAEAKVAAYVREWWCDVERIGGVPATAPDDDTAAVDLYFAAIDDESYTITDAPITSVTTESDPAVASSAPTEWFTTGVTAAGLATVTVAKGGEAVTIAGTYRDLRDMLRDCSSRLYAIADTKAIERYVWDTIIAEIRSGLTAIADELNGHGVNEVIDGINSLVVSAWEWDNGWFPYPHVSARGADGTPIELADMVDRITIGALDDGDLTADLDDLTGGAMTGSWECRVSRPDA